MGVALLNNRTGKSRPALDLLKKIWLAIENSPPEKRSMVPAGTKAKILEQMGIATQILDRPDKAVALYTEACRFHPGTHLQLRIAYLDNSQLQATLAGDLEAAQGLVAQQKVVEAIAAFKAIVAVYPDYDRALHDLGELYRKRGEFQLALPLLQHALVMQPLVAEYQNTLGMLYQQLGDHAKAALYYRRALDITPDHTATLCNLGVAYKHLNRLDEAETAYNQAIALNPAMAEAFNNLGNLQRMTGDVQAAQASLEQAIALRPGYGDASRNLQALMQSQQADTANITARETLSEPPATKVKAASKPKAAPETRAAAKATPKANAKPKAKPKAKAKSAAKTKPKGKAKPKAQTKPINLNLKPR